MRAYHHNPVVNSNFNADRWSRLSGVSALKTLWERVASNLSGGSNLRIWQTLDPSGRVLWNVFDSKSDRTATLLSEDDVRAWIEESYNYVPERTWILQHPSESWIYQSDR